ncbi:hypothetical protein BGZ60DRAFT_26730 [Tricladium varicosporioides]|nr:hypothetical protein BGZ60DRAFT_26730 [Hymenoscyphus varicosporioides]
MMTGSLETNPAPKSRTAKACESCRASKSRCIFRSQQNICQKCEQSGGQCVVRSKARPMRTRNIKPASTASDPSASVEREFSLNLPPAALPNISKDVDDLHAHHKEFFGDESPQADAHYSNNGVKVVPQREVTLQDADALLQAFRKKAPFFPFVQIPDNATIPSMSRNTPFLLLAILTSASICDPQLYHQMDNEFRRVLSRKIIIEGKKSLDFLQGLLIYIAWYPIHTNPKNNQSFMYMNLAISLCTDLGLDQEIPNHSNFNSVDTTGLFEGDGFTRAAKRAYLGAYYMSAK